MLGDCPFQFAQLVGNPGENFLIGSGYGVRQDPEFPTMTSFHAGIDIPAAKNTYVRAADSGSVLRVRTSPTAGNYIVLKHPSGHLTKYMHLSTSIVNDGDVVKAGDVIGGVGSTGRSTGNHLHFELRTPQDTALDPTECYNNSQFISPYQSIPDQSLAPSTNGKGFPWIPVVVGGAVVVTGLTLLIIYAGRDKDKRKRRA